MPSRGSPLHIAIVLADLDDGGIQVSNLRLAQALQRPGVRISIVLCRKQGIHLPKVPDGFDVFGLQPTSVWRAQWAALVSDPGGLGAMLLPVLLAKTPPTMLRFLPSLARFFTEQRPDAAIVSATHLNLVAVLARKSSATKPVLAVVERNTLSAVMLRPGNRSAWRWRHVPPLIRRLYGHADIVAAVSGGVGKDLVEVTGLSRPVHTLYNPVVDPSFPTRAAAAVAHPWMQPQSPPVILGMGRLNDQAKGFSILLRAFAAIRPPRDIRLIVLGEGSDRHALETLRFELGLQTRVDFPGFVADPLPWLQKAACFVLSSRHEGLPAVLIEALACGCPVVSTDCPSGPAEILDNGAFGRLVAVDDVESMARAIVATLDETPDRSALVERAAMFSDRAAADRYLDLLQFPIDQRPEGAGGG